VTLQRPTPLDVSTLRVEKRGLPMNVAAVAILEPQALLDASGELDLDAIRTMIEHRLHLAPRLRQRLYWPGFAFGPPIWVDDPSFDIRRHVRTDTIPAVGSEEALLASCMELNEQSFDQAHPLWEIWLLTQGLDGRTSMLVRFHHVLADGTAALLLLGTLFDSAPYVAEPESPAWTPRPVPARAELLLDNLRRHIAAVRAGADRIKHPRQLLARGGKLLPQAAQLAPHRSGRRRAHRKQAIFSASCSSRCPSARRIRSEDSSRSPARQPNGNISLPTSLLRASCSPG
jgi:Wax ester synthase/diacylglycerol acyltransferase catalytic domain